MPTSILELSQQLRRRTVSPVELTRACLERIEKFNPALNAFIRVMADSALAQAQRAETEIQQGHWRGPLHGIPIGLKDLIDTAQIRTTAASALFKDRVPSQDATVVRCLHDAGAVILGKQNLHEFAYGGSSLISFYGPIHNPWNPACITGGSSGGSAAAVAASLGYAAIGTDTAGSIREPAALCGVVGLKPTYGRVSARGVVPLSQSLDHVGPLTRTVADAAILLQAIASPGRNGKLTNESLPDYLSAIREPAPGLRLGILRGYFYDDLDPEVASALDHAISVFQALGHQVRDLSLAVNSDRTLQAIESYMFHEDSVVKNPELYQPETLRRILSGSRFEWADYTRGLLELKQARQEIAGVFQEVDLLITPTTPIPAPGLAELIQNPAQLRPRELLLLRNTRPFNVWGIPAISIPCGFTNAGLPIGLQIAGPHWQETAVLTLAHAYEQATVWHNREIPQPF